MKASQLDVGTLVTSDQFEGIGKILELEEKSDFATIGFFESPLNPESAIVKAEKESLAQVELKNEAVVYFLNPKSNIWRRGRYGGTRPDDMHLVIPKSGEREVLHARDIYVINTACLPSSLPEAFLAARANDAPFLYALRERFISSYVKQRAGCRSISSLISSRVELEVHQLAIVSKVLRSATQKFLLADEVGLGKTIEAGMLIREHIIVQGDNAQVLLVVPKSLVGQWYAEMADRFCLEAVPFSRVSAANQSLLICTHEQLKSIDPLKATYSMIVVDEAHQISSKAWSAISSEVQAFKTVARLCDRTEAALLLSGTPLSGNERNFLAMLHCLSPEAYSIDRDGVNLFESRLREREKLGGIYGALTVGNSNSALDELLDELSHLYPNDENLMRLIAETRPHVDFFGDSSDACRDHHIMTLRKYVGEHYRLHQRVLRNRRENAGLEVLFPGLAGIELLAWNPTENAKTLDGLMDDFRLDALSEPDKYRLYNRDNFLEWVDALFENPIEVASKAQKLLNDDALTITPEESSVLYNLVETGSQEQIAKDQKIVEAVGNWLQENRDGKVVVFCGNEIIASHAAAILSIPFGEQVELHEPGAIPLFCYSESVKIFVCAEHGQDGLNLHGGKRLAVHYSLPTCCAQIEQRLGRLNRYSATMKGVKPVQSLAVTGSDEYGLSRRWLDLLNHDINIFRQTVASLQYVLEDFFKRTWSKYFLDGLDALDHAGEALSGQNGIIAKERKRVKAQEELMNLEREVREATEFSEQLYALESEAESHASDMLDWIIRGLRFRYHKIEEGVFSLRFSTEAQDGVQTLVDIPTLLETCASEFDHSKSYPPESRIMSVERIGSAVSNHRALPFRYGQPFVDAIWDLLLGDSRGSTCAYLRVLDKGKFLSPLPYFKFSWLVSAAPQGASPIHQRESDEAFPPRVDTLWISADGKVSDTVQDILLRPYSKTGEGYQDINLRHDVWPQISSWFDGDEWQSLTLLVAKLALSAIKQKYIEVETNVPLHFHQMSAMAIILCSIDTLSESEQDDGR